MAFRGLFRAAPLALALWVAWPGQATSEEATGFALQSLGSRHIGGQLAYEEFNPGLGLGLAWGGGADLPRLTGEIGAYRNSHAETSGYVMGIADWRAATVGPAELRTGLALGAALYPGRGAGFRRKGVPALGDWVPVVGATASLVLDTGPELRIGATPAAGIADVLVTFQIVRPLRPGS